jgi:hypothetical protein
MAGTCATVSLSWPSPASTGLRVRTHVHSQNACAAAWTSMHTQLSQIIGFGGARSICHMLVCTATPNVARLQQNCTSEHKHIRKFILPRNAPAVHAGTHTNCIHTHCFAQEQTVDPLHRRTCESLMLRTHAIQWHCFDSSQRRFSHCVYSLSCTNLLMSYMPACTNTRTCCWRGQRPHVRNTDFPFHPMTATFHTSSLRPRLPHSQCHVPQRHPRGRALLRHPPLR